MPAKTNYVVTLSRAEVAQFGQVQIFAEDGDESLSVVKSGRKAADACKLAFREWIRKGKLTREPERDPETGGWIGVRVRPIKNVLGGQHDR